MEPLQEEDITRALEQYVPNHKEMSKEDLDKLIETLKEAYEKYGFSDCRDYFKFNFASKTEEQRKTFAGYQVLFDYHASIDADYKAIVKNKYSAYCHFKKYYKRDIIKIDNLGDMGAYMQFVAKHKSYIVKQAEGSLANLICIINIDKNSNLKNEFLRIFQYEGAVIEELIVQCDEMAQFHPNSLNTVRIATHYENGKMDVIFGLFRVGRGDAFVDNTSMGGIGAAIDVKTGEVISQGYTSSGQKFENHPDTNIAFKGFKIPYWDELLEMLEQINKEQGDMKYIGWDVALTENGWVLVEANSRPDNHTIQIIMDDIRGYGMRKEFDFMYKSLGLD